MKKARDLQYEEKLKEKYAASVEKEGVLAEIKKREEEAKGLLEKVWLGGEGKDWKKKRDEREKEALEEGKGYGGLIMDQIWEVWNWRKDKDEEIKVKDHEVLEESGKATEPNKNRRG